VLDTATHYIGAFRIAAAHQQGDQVVCVDGCSRGQRADRTHLERRRKDRQLPAREI
jgi:hypothetical protein